MLETINKNSEDHDKDGEVEPKCSKRAKIEIDYILQNNTWELVDLPPGCKPLSSKWVFKRKRKVDGSTEKYKARLVIKCYKQTKWVLINLTHILW